MTRRIALAIVVLLCVGALVLTERRKIDPPAGPEAVTNFIASSERELTRLPMRFTRMSDEQEIRIGDAMVGPSDASQSTVEAYLQKVGGRVARGAHRKLPYRFHYVPQSEFVNAYALPGGHIMVGHGLLELMDSEDELASVLGHEIAHVDLYHCAERAQVQGAMRKIPLGGILALPVELFVAGYSKDQELEADRDGTQLSVLAGYSPAGALRFHEKFERLYERYEKGKPAKAGTATEEVATGAINVLRDYFRTHPRPSERIEQVKRQIESNHWDATKSETDLAIGWVFWTARASGYLASKQYAAAATWAERVLRSEARQQGALRVLADSRMALAEFDAAAAAYRKLLDVNPQDYAVMQRYADTLGASKHFGDFHAWATGVASPLPQARVESAGLAAMSGDLGPSQPALAQARSGDGEWERDWIVRLADWHYRARRYDSSKTLLAYVFPPQSTAYTSNFLGWLALEDGRLEDASHNFSRTTLEGQFGIAVAQWRLLNLDDALRTFAAAQGDPVWKNPRFVEAFYSPGVVETLRQMLHAEENVARRIKLRTELPEVAEILRHAVDIATVETALRLDPHSAAGWLAHGRFSHATRDFERAISFDPKLFDAYAELDALLTRQAQFARTTSYWSAYIQLVPDDSRGWLARARSHARAGELAAAAADGEQACKRGNAEGCKLQADYHPR